MFVGAAVSEIRESNRNKEKKKNLQNGYFQFNTFPRHIIDSFFHQSLARSLVNHKLKVIIGISLSTHIMLANQGHPYIHSTTVVCDVAELL